MRPSRPGPLVIGVGNRLRGDDAAGPILADRLAARWPEAEILVVQELLPELAERIAAAGSVLFLDASVAIAPGEEALEDLAPAVTAPGLGHALTPAVLLALASRLYGHCPPARVLRLGAADFTLGAALSAPMQAALERAEKASKRFFFREKRSKKASSVWAR